MPDLLQSVPLLDLAAQYATIREEIREAVLRVVDSQCYILGPEVEALEQEIAAYCQCRHAIGVSSGSDALLISLMALGIDADDEVILPTYTFFATAGAVARLGATPVFAEIDPETYNLDVEQIETLITHRTKAIIPVHLYGQMANMDAVLAVAEQYGLSVVEDAAQAIGAELQGRRAGSLGDLGCFSFYPSKNLGGIGDGGMVTTNSDELADRVRLLRNHGYGPKYYNKVVGGNFRLDAVQAAALRVKLKYLDGWTAARQLNAERYRRLFIAADHVTSAKMSLPAEPANVRHVYNQFVVRLPTHQRDPLRTHLAEAGVGTEIYYPVPLHLQECFSPLGYQPGELPEGELAADQTIALPIYAELGEEAQRYLVRCVSEYFHEAAGRRQAA